MLPVCLSICLFPPLCVCVRVIVCVCVCVLTMVAHIITATQKGAKSCMHGLPDELWSQPKN